MKDRYIETIEQAGFQDVEIVKSMQHSFEEAVDDQDAKVVVFNREKNTEELKSLSELGEEAKETMREVLKATMSINVLATKPSK